MERYTLEPNGSGEWFHVERPDGEWIWYDDYEAAVARLRAELRERAEDVEPCCGHPALPYQLCDRCPLCVAGQCYQCPVCCGCAEVKPQNT